MPKEICPEDNSGVGIYQLRNAKGDLPKLKFTRRVTWRRKFQLIVVLVEVPLQVFLTG